MSNQSTRQSFIKSEKAELLRAELTNMVDSALYNTKPMYSLGSIDKYQFVDQRMDYMSKFPNMDHWQYVLNLKLMTKIKS